MVNPIDPNNPTGQPYNDLICPAAYLGSTVADAVQIEAMQNVINEQQTFLDAFSGVAEVFSEIHEPGIDISCLWEEEVED